MECTLICLASADPKDIELYSSMCVSKPQLFTAKKVSSQQVPALSPMHSLTGAAPPLTPSKRQAEVCLTIPLAC